MSTNYIDGLLKPDVSDFDIFKFNLSNELGNDSTLDSCF